MHRELEYRISDQATSQLEARVDSLLKAPKGKLVGEIDFTDPARVLDRKIIAAGLPSHIVEEDFVKLTELVYYTESATQSYASVYYASAKEYRAPWLGEEGLIGKIWVPDELQHKDPFKAILLSFGLSETEINRRTREVQEAAYDHVSGSTPSQVTFFGTHQEFFTQYIYGLMYPVLKQISPVSAEDVKRVQGRESLHMSWFGDLTAIQIADNPDLLYPLIESSVNLNMPGKKLVPDLIEEAGRRIRMVGGDYREVERRMVRLTSVMVGNHPENLGTLAIGVAANKAPGLAQIPARILEFASRAPVLGREIKYIAGQAIQEREGIEPKSEADIKYWERTAKIRKPVVDLIGKVMEPLFLQDEVDEPVVAKAA